MIEGRVPNEFIARSNERVVAEYQTVSRELDLQEPLHIANPACGLDTSLSVAFPQSPIYYIDTDPHVVSALQRANLGPLAHIIHGSLIDEHVEDIDLVVLRSAIIPGVKQSEVVSAATQTLKSDGIVVASHYAMADTAKALERMREFSLVGRISSGTPQQSVHFDRGDVRSLAKSLRRDSSIPSQFGGVTFIFRKR
ncbi:MAG TPA: hypothetical protein VLF93_04310 [Candidatus Saccharimonadales bacterium]|nr:hypothetical protein [Candidatus Saccharimonadales bacterium]